MAKTVEEASTVPAQAGGRARRPRAEDSAPAQADGRRVVSDEPELSNLPGRPATKVRKVTLADGDVVYGCKACSFSDVTRDRVRAHYRTEHPDVPVPTARTAPARRLSIDVTDASITLAELIHLATSSNQWAAVVEQITAQRDVFKDRALMAEAKLRRLHAAMQRLGFVAAKDDD